jgi:pimeloyl-ACP methyl ester carboxylesterase
VPLLRRDDGAEIHWEATGDGPLVVLVPHWSGVPEVFDPLTAELTGDHRVVRYDARGTGESTRVGPHDMDTGAAELEAVIEAAGGPAVVVGIADASIRATRAGAHRSDLVAAVIGIAGAPVPREMFLGTESMIGSDTVVNAFLEMIETDYRGAIRSLLTAANEQMSEDELRQRVTRQADYCPHEVAVERLRAWASDDSSEAGVALGERLCVLFADDVAGPWFPNAREFKRRAREILPDARFEHIANGIVSRPDLTAELVRELAAPLRSGARPATR